MTKRDILWITMESVRWDHTNFADHKRNTTPKLENLSDKKGGFHSNNCFSHGIYTRSSTASILTGRAAINHGVGVYRNTIPNSISTISEQLSSEGYRTVCISPNGHISSATKLDRGFDEFRFITGDTIFDQVSKIDLLKYLSNIFYHSSGITTDSTKHSISYLNNQIASKYITNKPDEPLFMYVHYGDTHHPYIPPLKWRGKFKNDLKLDLSESISLAAQMKENILEEIADGASYNENEWASLKTLYDSLIAYVDHMIGRVTDIAQERLDDPIIVITSDHGENFGELNLLGHRLTVNHSLTNVPLVIYGLDHYPKEDDIIQHSDVWKLISDATCSNLNIPIGQNLRQTKREFAVAQLGGDRCQKNIDKIVQHNPDFDRKKFFETDLTALLTTDKVYRRSENKRELIEMSEDNKERTSNSSREFDRFEKLYESLPSEYTSPINHTEAEVGLEDNIKSHLKDMGYVID